MLIFSPNTIAKSSEINANFAETAGIVGEIRMWPTASAPTGWLLCQGQAISRTTYSILYSVIGTVFGSGNGSSTFNLPDFGGNAPVGYKSGDANFGTLGAKVGEATHTLSTAEMPSHGHSASSSASSSVSDPGHQHVFHGSNARSGYYYNETFAFGGYASSSGDFYAASNTAVGTGISVSTSVSTTVNAAGSGGAHNNIQPSITINFMIKY